MPRKIMLPSWTRRASGGSPIELSIAITSAQRLAPSTKAKASGTGSNPAFTRVAISSTTAIEEAQRMVRMPPARTPKTGRVGHQVEDLRQQRRIADRRRGFA